jgi:predicted TIM-barrel fold metal-dependent hydrolase
MSWNGTPVIDLDSHIVERGAPELTEQAKRKILGENAMRLCPRLRA